MEIKEYKVEKCLRCGSKTNITDNEEFFCSNCGAPIVNRCSAYDCDKFLIGDAKYCKYCGSPSIFENFGLFNPFTPTHLENSEDLPF